MSLKFKDAYLNKPLSYFSNVRDDIIKLIECNEGNILELGCGEGNTLIELKKQNKAKFIAGVDIVDLGQKDKLDKFVLADIETEEIDFPPDFFDIIIFADVLEHLKDPWNAVKKARKWLKPQGLIVASIPNIREIKTLKDIVLKGDFKYVDAGVLDKTHLRFFCKKNIIDLFESTGFKIEKITYNLSPKRNILNLLTFKIFEQFLVVQYLIVARKKKDKKWTTEIYRGFE